jgi:hypothetical protein
MRLSAAIAAACLCATAAHADPATTVNVQDAYTAILQPILLAVATAAATVITAAATLTVRWLSKKLGIQALELDAQHRDALDAALTNAAGLALNQLGNQLAGKTVDVRNPAIASAVSYVVKSAPDALDHFDLNGRADEIAQKIVAKLPQVANTTSPA